MGVRGLKLPWIKRIKYDDLKSKYDAIFSENKYADKNIKYISSVVLRWRNGKMGNLRAISEISKLFKGE